MIKLLIASESPAEDQPVTRFGGRPLVRDRHTFLWPRCAQCEVKTPMQFLGQIAVDDIEDGSLLVSFFMCAAEEGCCTWEADDGANFALVQAPAEIHLINPPADASTALRPCQYGARVEVVKAATYDLARSEWTSAAEGRQRQVLGQVGGKPDWIQGDQTPICECGKVMQFVAQLEQGPVSATEMNFGGGCAFVFRCGTHSARLLWQQ